MKKELKKGDEFSFISHKRITKVSIHHKNIRPAAEKANNSIPSTQEVPCKYRYEDGRHMFFDITSDCTLTIVLDGAEDNG